MHFYVQKINPSIYWKRYAKELILSNNIDTSDFFSNGRFSTQTDSRFKLPVCCVDRQSNRTALVSWRCPVAQCRWLHDGLMTDCYCHSQPSRLLGRQTPTYYWCCHWHSHRETEMTPTYILITRSQSNLAAPNDTARAAKFSCMTDRQTDRLTDNMHINIVCISCIWCSLIMLVLSACWNGGRVGSQTKVNETQEFAN